jgi:phosphoglycerate dehydrogenase-like enzyme
MTIEATFPTTEALTVVIAAPLDPDLVHRIDATDPRVRVIHRPDLLPPMRHPADFLGEPEFRRSSRQQAEFRALLEEADILFGVPDQDSGLLRDVIAANPRLRWVHTTAAGGGGQVRAARLDEDALRRVVFTSSAGVHAAPLTEFALFALLAGAKDLPRLEADRANRRWPDRWMMRQLSDQTVLILGMGGIGASLAKALHALGCRVIGVNRSGSRAADVDRLVSLAAVEEELPEVDAVVCALPATAATEGFVDARFLGALKKGATVVSVGRGSVIDEQALLHALDAGQVGFAALDVFCEEPLPVSSPLWGHPRVLVSPHTAALTDREEQRIASLFIRNLNRLLENQSLENRIDVVEFY